MFVIMGASGHVGAATADALIERGQPVTAILHDPKHGDGWRARGADVAVADIEDVGSLRAVFARGRRAFLLNPPADIKCDTDEIERGTVAKIIAALEASGLEKVVAASTVGAMPGRGIGDSSVLWEFEQGLAHQSIPAAINRAGFYMSNWDAQLEGVRTTGLLHSMYPADFALPMIAPRDLGAVAADRLMSPVVDIGIRCVEGPRRYTAADVAEAFAMALDRRVDVVTTPPEKFREAYRELGFSAPAAEAYARMAEETLRSDFDDQGQSLTGTTSLVRYIDDLVRGQKSR